MAATQTVAPTINPVSLAEAKSHLRVDTSDDDLLVDAQIGGATRWVEEHTGRQLIDATWKLTLDRFPRNDKPIILPYPPVTAITSVSYHPDGASAVTFDSASYFLDNSDDYDRHRIVLASLGDVWPQDTLRPAAGVEITYTAGYGAEGSDVPEAITTAIKQVVGSLYEHRETVVVGTIAQMVPDTARMLLDPYQLVLL